MFKFLAKIFAFLTSPKAQKALDLADKAVDLAKDAQKKLPKAK